MVIVDTKLLQSHSHDRWSESNDSYKKLLTYNIVLRIRYDSVDVMTLLFYISVNPVLLFGK